MTISSIQAAIDQYLMDQQGSVIDIAWEGVQFFPNQMRPFLAPKISSVISEPIGPGVDAVLMRKGNYLINLWFPIGQGMQPVRQKADEIEALFKRGTTILAQSGPPVVFEQCSQIQAIQEGNWIHVPVNAAWFVYEAP